MLDTITTIESALKGYLDGGSRCYREPLYEAMEYSLMAGGKRIRPRLTLAFADLCGGSLEDTMPFACAIEMIHTYSLIHDDLPCMDNDALRRGKPTNHMVYGEDMALLAGDGLLTLAFEIMLQSGLAPERTVKAAGILARLSGVTGMIGGQCIDLKSEGRQIPIEEMEAMDMGKTVALIKAACLMGTVVAGGTEKELAAAQTYAEGIGMAFQIRDDILDVVGDPVLLGKNTGMDTRQEKCNYVTLLGVEKAQQLVEDYTNQAVSALNTFAGDSAALADFAREMAGRTV